MDVILIFLYPHDALLWLYNVHKIGKRPVKGLLTVALTIFLFSLTLSLLFLKRSSQYSQYLHLKSAVELIEGTLGKTTFQHYMAPNYSDTCISARLGNDSGNEFDLGYRQNVDPSFGPLFGPPSGPLRVSW